MFKKHAMNGIKIELIETLPKELEETVDQEFEAYETSQGVDVNYRRFSLILKDMTGNVIGILNAFTAFAEIYVDDILVFKKFRGKGYGKKLLLALEDHFKGKGFNNINLVTSAFQAPDFYKKCGYQVEFVRENKKNPKLTKTFFIKYFDEETQNQGVLEKFPR